MPIHTFSAYTRSLILRVDNLWARDMVDPEVRTFVWAPRCRYGEKCDNWNDIHCQDFFHCDYTKTEEEVIRELLLVIATAEEIDYIESLGAEMNDFEVEEERCAAVIEYAEAERALNDAASQLVSVM